MALVPTQEFWLRLALHATGVAATVLNGAKIHLAKANFTAGRDLALADLTEATFGGYAIPAVETWDTPIFEVDGTISVQGAEHEFLGDGTLPEESIYGYYLSVPAVVGPPAIPETVLASEKFDAPRMVGGEDTGVRVAPLLVL